MKWNGSNCTTRNQKHHLLKNRQDCETCGCWFSITVPNLVQKLWLTPKLCPKTTFKMAATAILNLFPVAIFNTLLTSHFTLLISTTTQNFVQISQPTTNLYFIITFWNSRWRPSAMLDFRKPAYWASYHLMLSIFHHCTKFGAKILTDAEIMPTKPNSNSGRRHLEFIYDGYF